MTAPEFRRICAVRVLCNIPNGEKMVDCVTVFAPSDKGDVVSVATCEKGSQEDMLLAAGQAFAECLEVWNAKVDGK